MLLLWALVAVASATAVSKNIYVDSASGADDQNCLSMAAACKTLQRAFDIVNPTDVIFCSGSFAPQDLPVSQSVTVTSYPGKNFGLSCAAPGSALFRVALGAFALQNAQVTGCSNFAIIVSTASVQVSLSDCTFVGSPVSFQQGPGSSVTGVRLTVTGFKGAAVATTAFRTYGSPLSISHSTFNGNMGVENGGVIDAFAGATLSLFSVLMANNSGVRGGAVFADASAVTFMATICESNTASTSGGCVYVRGAGSSFVAGNVPAFTANTATAGDGGAIAITGAAAQVSLAGAICEGNQASKGGGCLFMTGGGTLGIVNASAIRNNAALAGNGSGLALYQVQSTLGDTVFDSNSKGAVGYGGAFYISGGSAIASDLVVINSKEALLGQGSAGMLTGGGTFTLGVAQLAGNSFGEGIVCLGSSGVATGATLTADSVVCGDQCVLTINSDTTVCTKQSSPGSAPQSFVLEGNSLRGVAGSWVMATVQVFDVYFRKATTTQLGNVMRDPNGQTAPSKFVVSNPVLGTYAVNFTTPQNGVFFLSTTIGPALVRNSPATVTVAPPGEEPTNLTGLWVVLGLVLAGALVVGVVFMYRRYVKRVSYMPIADTSSKQASYGGTGFGSEAEDV